MIYTENILICLAMPMIAALFVLRGAARRFTGFLLTGMACSLLSAYCNTFLSAAFRLDAFDAVVKLTPICEETIKMLPILFYLLLVSPERGRILPAAAAVGIGFATFENCCYIVQYGAADTLFLLLRGSAVGTLHMMTSAILGSGLAYSVYKRPYRSFVSVFGLWCLSSSIHAIYNLLVASEGVRQYVGYLMPIFIFLVYLFVKMAAEKSSRRPEPVPSCK